MALLSILPQEGNYANMRILSDLRMGLSYTEEETKKWTIQVDRDSQTISWKEDGEAEIPIGEKATSIILDELRKLDKQNQLTAKLMPIYEKFIPTIE